jgi:hypothetical protein
MSIEALDWAFKLTHPDMTSTMKLVLLVLADFAGDEDEAYPRQSTISARSMLTREAVNKNLKRLETIGFIQSTGRKHPTGATRSSVYKLIIHRTTTRDPKDTDKGVNGGHMVAVNDNHTRANEDHTRSERGTQGGENEDHTFNLPIEPSNEPPTVNRARKTAPWPEDFRDQFWNEVPRKIGRDAAIAKLERIEKQDRVEFKDILEGMRRYANSPTVRADRSDPERRRFIVHPVTWLNQGRWQDEDEPSRGPGPRAVKRVAI